MNQRFAPPTGDRLELLETFVRVADAGGVVNAARSLDAPHQTVSRRVQQLEALIGARLLERGGVGPSLTPLGARLLPEARELTERWRAIEGLIDAEEAGVAGVVRVGAGREIATGLMPALIAEFLRRHPEARVELRALDDAATGMGETTDFAVVEGKPSLEEGVAKEVARVRRGLVAAPILARTLAARHGVSIERCEPLTLAGAPLVSPASLYRGAVRFSGRMGEQVEVGFERIASVDGPEATLDLAVLGVGLAILPHWRVRPHLADGRLVRVAAEWAAQETPVSLCWSPSRFRSPAASALLELVREALPALLEDG